MLLRTGKAMAGVSAMTAAKFLLEKQFLINKDYTILLTPQVKQTNDMKGGHNREIFMLNTETFKKFCLEAGTKKADEIHDYFIKLEKVLQEVIHEESNELKLQLEEKNVDGTHIIGGKIYDRLIGSREDVWNEKCYKTSGGLTKDDLIIHKSGKIISKNKSVQEKSDNKFLKFGLNKVEDY